MNTLIKNVNNVNANSTKTAAIGDVAPQGMAVVSTSQDVEVNETISEGQTSVADQLTNMLEEANAFFKDEQAKIVSRDEASAKFASCMVALGERYHRDPEFRAALEQECLNRSIPLYALPGSASSVSGARHGQKPMNEFLPVVKLVDGEWGNKVNRFGKAVEENGEPVQVWHHNRSLEKYAPFIECCIRNDLTSDAIYEILRKGGEFDIGNGVKVKATITAIIKFNAKQKGATSRQPTVWKPEVRDAAKKVTPLFSVNLTEKQKSIMLEGSNPLFTPSEDGYAAAIVRFTDNGLEILGDLLMTGNPLLERVRKQTENMTSRNAEFLEATKEDII